MSQSILQNGYPSMEELKQFHRLPSEERCKKGPVAVIECIQPIPCNPCEAACRFQAIHVGEPIINLPQLNEEKCVGCGACIAHCSGLAIFVVDKTYSENEATVSFPHEYLPLPEKGDMVDAVNRAGDTVCKAKVIRVVNPEANDHTPVVTVAVPLELADEVRGMVRLGHEKKTKPEKLNEDTVSLFEPENTIVCRCEEVTVGDIRQALAEGMTSISGIKKRTRAGMGLCQGRTCSKLVTRMLSEYLSENPAEITPDTVRAPVKPVTFGTLAEEEYL